MSAHNGQKQPTQKACSQSDSTKSSTDLTPRHIHILTYQRPAPGPGAESDIYDHFDVVRPHST